MIMPEQGAQRRPIRFDQNEANSILDGLKLNYYQCILADPPWRFRTWNKATAVKRRAGAGTNVCASVHYNTLSIEELMKIPVADVASDNCCLFIWSCWPTILDTLQVIKSWGFEYKTCAFDWMKARDGKLLMGMGYWTRANTEPCLLATRGKPKRVHADVRQAILEPRREHSRKPDCVHGRIERLVSGPYLELFARQKRANWTVRGDEVGRFK